MDIFHPVHIGLCEALGNKFYSAVLNDLDRRLGQRLHLDKPLGACERLDNGAAAVAAADVVVIRLDLNEIALLLEVGHDGLARLVAIHAVVLSAVYYLRILVNAEDLLKIVSEADLIVVRVVAGRHFDSARAEAKLNILVGNDGELSADQRQDGVLADKVLIALVIGVNGNAGVAEHGLGTCGRDDELLVRILDGVSYVPERAGHILVLDLGVGKRRTALGTPVDDAAALIDKSLFVQLAECFAHALCACFVHRERASVPIAGCAEHLLLLNDAVAVFVLPFPNAVEEFLAAEVIARKAFLNTKLLFDLYLRRDAGVIGAGKPKCGIALHALIARQYILQGRVKRVTHVQLTCYVGGRHNY